MLDLNRQKFNEKAMERLIILYTSGESVVDIAKKLNVNRSTIYNWLDREDVKAGLEKARRYAERQACEIIAKDINTYITDIKALAKQKTDKRTSLAANQYLMDRILGRTTAKLDIEASTKQIENIGEDIIDAELDELE